MNKGYSFVKGLEKGALAIAVFAIPLLINQFPMVANLTIGGLLLMLANWLKQRFG